MADYLASIFGTEKDKINCPFYFKIGACRHGDKCSRVHNKPTFSQTIVIPGMYPNPRFAAPGTVAPQYTPDQLERHFEDFMADTFEEFAKYGPIEDMVVCDNLNAHLLGCVYVKYYQEEDAQHCLNALGGRFYNGKPLHIEFSPVTDFREAKCRQAEKNMCSRGGICNFMHVKRLPRFIVTRLQEMRRQYRDVMDKVKSEDRHRRDDRRRPRSNDRDRSAKRARSDRRSRSRSRSYSSGSSYSGSSYTGSSYTGSSYSGSSRSRSRSRTPEKRREEPEKCREEPEKRREEPEKRREDRRDDRRRDDRRDERRDDRRRDDRRDDRRRDDRREERRDDRRRDDRRDDRRRDDRREERRDDRRRDERRDERREERPREERPREQEAAPPAPSN